ncbi:MAG: hypothetical protein R2762_01790 [Bryobacteraceae bacterium]
MALIHELELAEEVVDATRAGIGTYGIALYGAAIGAVAGAALVSLGPVPAVGGVFDLLAASVEGRFLLVLAGVGAGGAVGALLGLIKAAAGHAVESSRVNPLA